MAFSNPRARDNTSKAAAPMSHVTEYSTRMRARRTEASTSRISSALKPVITFRRRSKSSPPGFFGNPALVLQDVHEHSEQHMNNIVDGFRGRDRRAPRAPRQHAARHFHETEPPPLQHHQRLDLRILQRKTPAEHGQRAAVHAHKSRSRIANRLAQNRPQHHAKKTDARRPQQARAATVPVYVTRANHHLTA